MKLTLEDLSTPPLPRTKAGVKVWHLPVEGKKVPLTCVAWEDLVLLNPRLEWPDHVHPEREEGWPEDSLRLTWVEDLGRVVVRSAVLVYDLAPVLALARGECARLEPTRDTDLFGKHRIRRLERPADEAGVYLTESAVRRITLSLGKEFKLAELRKIDFRLHGTMVLVWANRKLRAVASAVLVP